MRNKQSMGEERVTKLLSEFAVPSIIAMLVSSLYNIVDQFFIGRSVGELGNAATNISFPFSIMCVAIALLFESVVPHRLTYQWVRVKKKKQSTIWVIRQ